MAGVALIAALLFAVVAAFQVALALGVPWGNAAYGGRAADEDGRLPSPYRAMSAIAALFLAVAATLALARGGLVELGGVADRTLGIVMWAIAAMMALNTVANVASTSRVERMAMGGATAMLTICCVILALG